MLLQASFPATSIGITHDYIHRRNRARRWRIVPRRAGKTVFVAGACPGDIASLEVYEDKATFSRARIIALPEPSAHRIEEPCQYAPICGGCPWQHISYEQQLIAKRSLVIDAFVRVGKLEAAYAEGLVGTVLPSPKQWAYRNKVEFQVGRDKGKLALGLHGGQGAFVPIKSCPLLPKGYVDTPKAVEGALRYALGAGDSEVLRVGVRVSERTKEAELALWTPPGPFPRSRVAQIVGDAKPFTSMVRVLLKGPQKQRKVGGVEALSGKGSWREQVLGSSYSVSAPSFFQVNTLAADHLVNTVLATLPASSPEGGGNLSAFDLYSGCGTFTLPLAKAGFKTTAIESYGSSVRDLKRNLEDQGLDVKVIGGDVARELPELGSCDFAVIDPPRGGLDPKVVQALCDKAVPQLVYVSCNPSTLARDLCKLCASTYTIDAVTPVDLFPGSYHIETVVHLCAR